jgi:hypothetical protein
MSHNLQHLLNQAFSDMGDAVREKLYLTGLNDTPSGYLGHSGDYMIVNDGESGIHFTGIEKIAQDLTDYGFGGGSSDIPKYTNLPDPTENDGKIVASGCELYHSCDGEWAKIIKQDTITTLSPGESDGLPGCVTTVEDKANYIIYRDEVITENASNTFSLSLQGLSSPQLHEACLFAEFQGVPDDSIKLNFVESDYQWAIAPDSLLHPQIHYDSPTATQVFTLNNSNPYDQFNPQSMPLLDQFVNYPSQISDMHFSEDGLRAVGFGYQSLYVHEYLFTQPYDLSTSTRSKFKQIRSESDIHDYYPNLAGRLGVVETDDPSIIYVYYAKGVERKTLDTPGDLYSINADNDWYARNSNGNSQDSYFGYYQTWYNHNNRYDLVSMDFANNGSTLIVLFSKNYSNDTNDELGYLVSYELETPYLLPGDMPLAPNHKNQVSDEFLPEPSAVVSLDSFDARDIIGNKIFNNGKYIFLNYKNKKKILLEMGVPGDLNTLFIKGEIRAHPNLDYDDNLFASQTNIFPKNNLDLFMFTTNYNDLISSSLSSARGQLDEGSCQFVEWKTSEQSLISNSSNPSNAKVTFDKNLSITGVFNCN